MYPRAADAPALTVGAASAPRVNIRAIAAGVASVLATLLLVLSVLTINAHALLLDTDHWVAAIGPTASNPQVQAALSTYLADEIVDATGIDARLETVFPNQPLVSQAVASSMFNLFQRTLQQVFASDAFERTWIALNRAAHTQLVGALRGESSTLLKIQGNTLYLDLTPLIARGMEQLRQRLPGLASFVASLPARADAVGIDASRQDVGAAVGRQLPDNFGIVPIVQSDQLPKLQALVRFFDALVFILPLAALLLAALSLYLVTHRARMLAILAAEVAVAFLLAHLLSEWIVSTLAGNVGPGALEIMRAVVADLLRFDVLLIGLSLVVFVATVVIAFVRPSWATLRS